MTDLTKGEKMELKSSIENRTLNLEMLVVLITPKDRDSLVELLKSMPKRAKMDRLDEYMLDNLIQALENPEIVQDEHPIQSEQSTQHAPEIKTEIKSEAKIEPEKIDKKKIVNEIKARVDISGKEEITDWIKNSIKFGQEQFGIKTVPKSITPEGFYDWLLAEGIIFADGRPNPSAGKK